MEERTVSHIHKDYKDKIRVGPGGAKKRNSAASQPPLPEFDQKFSPFSGFPRLRDLWLRDNASLSRIDCLQVSNLSPELL